jgi:hypothetical protein
VKLTRILAFVAFLAPGALSAQVPTAVPAPDTAVAEPIEAPPPPGLAAAETGRSQRCVVTLARMDTLDTKLAPLANRSLRLRVLYEAVTREDTTRAAPFDTKDPIEAAVTRWYTADQRLAVQYSTTGDSLVEVKRAEGRNEISARLRAAIDSVSAQGQAELKSNEELQAEIGECQGVVFVRSAVRESCPPSLTIPLCAAARVDSIVPGFTFVNDPLEMWDIESASLWSVPQRLSPGPNGGLLGGESSVSERRGNLQLSLAVRLYAQERSTLTADQLAGIQVDLDSIGITFKHPQFILYPVLGFEFVIADPIAGENFYFLHFGDLSQPSRDVIWSGPAPGRGPTRMILPAKKWVLDRLAAGEIVSLTAVKFADATTKQAEAVYNLELTSVRQSSSVAALVAYFTGGDLEKDFSALVPPPAGD